MTQLVRITVARRILDNIEALALTTTNGSPLPILDHVPSNAPNDVVPREFIALGTIDGEAALTHLKTGRKSYTDEYEIDLIIHACELGKTGFANRERCGELTQAVIDCLRDDAGLVGAGGIDGHASLQLGALNGPNDWPLDTKDGWGAEAVLTVSATTHKLA